MSENHGQPIQMIPIDRITIINRRGRGRTKFKQIMTNIAKIGLKRPITLAKRGTHDGQPRYDLVCGQGRLESYIAHGQSEVPAVVIEVSEEDVLLMSLVENLARRRHVGLQLLHEIGAMKERGHDYAEIAELTDLDVGYIRGIIRLLNKGEEGLLRAVDSGQIPVSVAITIASSDDEAVTATLDLAEINGTVAIPVEYRKGRPRHPFWMPPDDPGENDPAPPDAEPWPTDRVQVGLQAILLEEAGYTVPEAILYYAAEKLRLRIPVNAALREEALSTLRAAKETAATKKRPLPLVNDPRCLRCSLQPICLPDEVNQQRACEESVSPRRIWPTRDDALHVVAQQDGTRIGISGLALKITDKDGKESRKIPIASLESLAVLGGVQVSTQALHALADRNVPVAFMSTAGRLVAMVDPLDSVSADVRRAQVRVFDQPARCLELARALISAKIINQRVLLQRNHSSIPDMVMEDLLVQAEAARVAASIDAMRGHEGQAAAIYFEHFAGMFKTPIANEFDTNGRQRRPPPDPINAVLSFAYTMLAHECVSALRLARLEPTLGAFHTCRPGRPALALDLMEPFRPLIADSVAVSSFNRGELTEGHFLRTAAGCSMTDSGRRAFFGAWGRRMDTEVTHPVFGYKLSYRRMLMLHARMIAAWLLGEVPTLAFLTTR